MLPSIPTEASYAQWLVNCIQKYFEGIGFTFYSEIQSQTREKDYPFDIYARISKENIVKRFGLQVKRPHKSKRGIYWNLDSNQHIQMNKFHWIYYSLPDFLLRRYYKVACYHIIFKDSNFPFTRQVYKWKIGFYYRLGAFANALMDCSFGQTIDQSSEWLDSISLLKEFNFVNQFHTYLDFTERKGQVFSNIQVESNRKED